MEKQQKVYNKLDEMNIPYELVQHPAAYTIEDMEQLGLDGKGDVVKNLFLRDDRGKHYYLVVVDKDKKVDLQSLRTQLGSSKLGFASEERLDKYLKLTKGSVTPFGVINDEACEVNVIFDKDLKDKEKIGVHPNDNRATVFISFEDLKRVIESNGHKIIFAEI